MSRKCEAPTLAELPELSKWKRSSFKMFFDSKKVGFSPALFLDFAARLLSSLMILLKFSRFVIKRVYKPRIRKYKISSDFHVLSILLTGNVFRDEII